MHKRRGRVVEVETLAEFDRRISQGTTSMTGWHLQSVDLSGRGEQLHRLRVAGALFLGCTFAVGDEDDVRARGGIVFPVVPDVPVDTYRGVLYTPAELFDTTPYDACLDARVYAWSKQPPDLDATLAQALHDHAVDNALGGWRTGRHLVGVMGGHALQRGEPAYADAAQLGRLLASGDALTVATGGGPGAMEAANLGAWMSAHATDDLQSALTKLAEAPSFRPDVGVWAKAAFEVLADFPEGTSSLGIPTWHYGHEPPNAFASAIAKYFRNATREAILLEVCDAGIVFLPGAGGTVQEIFQDACENYYADESSVAPMVLVGVEHWTRTVPAWPLLRALAAGRPMEPHVHLVDTIEEAVELVRG
ncbi:LOG family protein [Nocardioides jensenii]|uniref:LOG family protein n=1 Tax=Nocardioides jensenii TaxID=1843 RepID=UPI00082B987F|nr:Rossmann fold nucleotide-binding protein [Nocardioides jensenii]